MEAPLDLAVIGGGAAGFFAALNLAEQRPGSRIAIFERSERFLQKVKVSGGGRCNVTHACYEPRRLVEFYPRGGKALLGAFHRFGPADMTAWLEQRGVPLKTEQDGRIFPVTDHSETIIDCFLHAARQAAITLHSRAAVRSLRLEGLQYMLELANGSVVSSRCLLLATGGDRAGHRLAQALGHTIQPPVPSLFTFHLADARLNGLAGVSAADVELQLPQFRLRQRGPVLVTHSGISGPGVIRLSAWAARPLAEAQYQADLRINWLPGQNLADLDRLWALQREAHPRGLVESHDPAGQLPQRLWRQLVQATLPAGLRWSSASRRHLEQLREQMTGGSFRILGKSLFKEEFVTCGGVTLDELDFKTMQSRVAPGLFLAGEVLDIDGLTGGFNFQNAWTTAWIAAGGIAARLGQ